MISYLFAVVGVVFVFVTHINLKLNSQHAQIDDVHIFPIIPFDFRFIVVFLDKDLTQKTGLHFRKFQEKNTLTHTYQHDVTMPLSHQSILK